MSSVESLLVPIPGVYGTKPWCNLVVNQISSPGQSMIMASLNALQSVPNGTDHTVVWNVINYSSGSDISFVPGGTTFTVLKTGIYEISYQLSWANTTTGNRQNRVKVPFSYICSSQIFQGSINTESANSSIIPLNANDTIFVQCSQDSGAALNLGTGNVNFQSYVCIRFLG